MIKHLFVLFLLLSFVACKTKKAVDEPIPPQNYIEVDLRGKMEPARLVTSFPSLGLVHLCQSSKEENKHIFQFDDEAMTKEEIIGFLDKEVGVEYCIESFGCGYLD